MRVYITSWHDGREFIAAGRNKFDRPVGSNARIRRDGEDVVLRLHDTDVVRFHPDGTQTIHTGGWNTQLTRKWINACSAANVWAESNTQYVQTHSPEYTPSRFWKCRRCKGRGKNEVECWGGPWCHPKRCYGATPFCFAYGGRACEHGERTTHRVDQPCEHGEIETHTLPCEHDRLNAHRLPCEHGFKDTHQTGWSECWQCKGVGKYEYGCKPIHFEWLGHPLRIEADGEPIGYVKPSHSVPEHSGNSYGDSGRLLKTLLPGLTTHVNCPTELAPGPCPHSGSLDATIIHLNDSHRWTREQIADWLETLDVDLAFPTPAEV